MEGAATMKGSKGIAILDTNVASYMLKGLPLGAEYTALTLGYDLRLSFVTTAELRVWANRNRLGPKRRLYLDLFLREFTVIPYSAGMDRLYAKVMHERESIGRPLEPADAWIATTALFYRAPLVTHDADFVHTRDLRIITASDEVRANQMLLRARHRQPPLLPDMRCRCSF
jgi:predicted nucleic acid-binding protein